MYPYDPPPDVVVPPGEDELPCDDGVPLETQRHAMQMMLLAGVLNRDLASRRPDYFVGTNMFLYFSELQVRKNDFRGPDVFVALGVERRERKSWVMWGEGGKAPDVIIELTSDSTRAEDHGPKKRTYAMLHVPEYFIYDPFSTELEGFRLDIDTYRSMEKTAQGRLVSTALGLDLGIWEGEYLAYPGQWLRPFRDGKPVLLAEEVAAEETRLREEERRLREEERRRREEAERKLADALAELEKLRGK